MKKLNVKKVSVPQNLKAEQVIEILDSNNIPFEVVDNVNWSEYPYKPSMKFRIAHTGDKILVNYEVEEASVRAVAPHDNGSLLEDAFCEFFLQPDEASGKYYNFECNCAGTLLNGYGVPGDREHACDEIHSLDGRDMRANFYKCGDKLTTPHFLSWNKIDLPSPCFHCPPFFGQIHFEA